MNIGIIKFPSCNKIFFYKGVSVYDTRMFEKVQNPLFFFILLGYINLLNGHDTVI